MNKFKVKKLNTGSLGEKLRLARESKKFSISSVSRVSGIPVKYLEYLENENWKALPGEIYLKNFLKKYCKILGLNQKLCIAQYEKEKSLILERTPKRIKKFNLFKKIKEFITPRRITLILIYLGVAFFVSYIAFGIMNYIKPPEIKIIYPEKNFVTIENSIVIHGKTEPESILFVNDEAVGVSETGDFFIDIKLKPGLNTLDIVAQKKHSRKNFEQIIIYKKDY
ncbi:MAG TPA: helix-turn-helix domain-containing protein [bacterium]|jgi:transcriptional regulator with XRE-family HTH domain|nr:helix-turn-helix domain-containing protein [bacterium]